jgi:hypothetical protein
VTLPKSGLVTLGAYGPLGIRIRCGKLFNKIDYIDCKIIVFEMKKRAFFTPYKTGSKTFESSWLKTLVLHKLEEFDIILET